jgi:hypothetical protein
VTQVPVKRVRVEFRALDGTRLVVGDTSDALQLSVDFQCRMTARGQRNVAGVTILNLSASNRNTLSKMTNTEFGIFEQALLDANLRTVVPAIEGDDSVSIQERVTLENGQAYCLVDAGEDENIGRVFEGSVESVKSRQQGPDWVTTVVLSDGQATANKTFSFAGRKGGRTYDLVARVLEVMGCAHGNFTPEQFAAATSPQLGGLLLRSKAIVSNCDGFLNTVLKLSQAEWWVDRGAFYIVRKGQPLVDRTLVLRSEQGGLRTAPEQLDKGAISIQSDFRRGLRVGRKIVVDYGGEQSAYRADLVGHHLHTREGDFGSFAVLRPIPNPETL